MNSFRALALVITLLVPDWAFGASDRASWQNLNGVPSGQPLKVRRRNGATVTGTFASVSADSLHLRVEQQDIAIPHSEVSQVQRQSAGRHKAMWLGLAIGGGAGAGIGAGVAEGVSNTSGGDFANLKPAVIGVIAAAGALAGLAIGSVLDSRHNTLYKSK
jgi:hypothetical protein